MGLIFQNRFAIASDVFEAVGQEAFGEEWDGSELDSVWLDFDDPDHEDEHRLESNWRARVTLLVLDDALAEGDLVAHAQHACHGVRTRLSPDGWRFGTETARALLKCGSAIRPSSLDPWKLGERHTSIQIRRNSFISGYSIASEAARLNIVDAYADLEGLLWIARRLGGQRVELPEEPDDRRDAVIAAYDQLPEILSDVYWIFFDRDQLVELCALISRASDTPGEPRTAVALPSPDVDSAKKQVSRGGRPPKQYMEKLYRLYAAHREAGERLRGVHGARKIVDKLWKEEGWEKEPGFRDELADELVRNASDAMKPSGWWNRRYLKPQ